MSAADAPAWILYLRDHCGLCDQALGQLAALHFAEPELVWIDTDPRLEAIYGTRIPVLQHRASGRCLDWPFDAAALAAARAG